MQPQKIWPYLVSLFKQVIIVFLVLLLHTVAGDETSQKVM